MEKVQRQTVEQRDSEDVDFRPKKCSLLAFRMDVPSYRFVYQLNNLFKLNLKRHPQQLPVPFNEANTANANAAPLIETSFYYNYNSLQRVHYILLQLPKIDQPVDNISCYFNTYLFINGVDAKIIRNRILDELGSNSIRHFDPNDLIAARREPYIEKLRKEYIIEAHSFDFEADEVRSSFFNHPEGFAVLRKHRQFGKRIYQLSLDMLYFVENKIKKDDPILEANKDYIKQWEQGEDFSCNFTVIRR